MDSNIFRYKVINETSIIINQRILNTIEKVLEKWNSIITYNPSGRIVDIDLYFQPHENNSLLGYASPITAVGNQFGNMFVTRCKIVLNTNVIFNFNENFIYNLILHEFGHALGIGIFWYMRNSPIINIKEDDGIYKKYYIGYNALREYKRLLNNKNIVGLPIEDNGLEGTIDYHIEEGDVLNFGKEISKNNRYVNGVLHHGLQNELMTGWADNTAVLSRITVGLLEDIGYGVDYLKADYFNPLNLSSDLLTYQENIWNLPDLKSYSLSEFYNKMNYKYDNNYNFSKLKILIIDAGVDKIIVSKLGYPVTPDYYKNFTGNKTGNDKKFSTYLFKSMIKVVPDASYYFAESEWMPTETIKEVDNLIEALKWGKELEVDIIVIPLWYSFDDSSFYSKKREVESIINSMTNTLVVVTVSEGFDNRIYIPNDIENTITVGNSRGTHNYKPNLKPDIVLPNINQLVNDEFWDDVITNSKLVGIMSTLLAICLIERPTMSKNQIKDTIFKTASEDNERHNKYGYGVPMLGNFLKETEKYALLKYQVTLKNGWNFISFPLNNINIKSLTENKDILEIKNNEYNYNINNPAVFNNLSKININSSYWIRCSKETSFKINGFKIEKTIFQLKKGWNMISCPFIKKIHLSKILNSNIVEIKSAYRSYDYKMPEFSNLEYIEPFKGYYLKVSKDLNLTLLN